MPPRNVHPKVMYTVAQEEGKISVFSVQDCSWRSMSFLREAECGRKEPVQGWLEAVGVAQATAGCYQLNKMLVGTLM